MIKTEHHASLKNLNTFGLDAIADVLIRADDENGLIEALGEKRVSRDAIFLGGGSNILIANPLLKTVIQPVNDRIEVVGESPDHVLITCGAGRNWDEFVEWSVKRGYGGLENLSGIPGNVGASPIQNIGAYGCEAALCIESVRVIDFQNAIAFNLLNHECRFGYRDSIFKTPECRSWLIWEVTFQLDKEPRINLSYKPLKDAFGPEDHPSPLQVREEVLRIRESKLPDPSVLGNAGSFFRNPVVTACAATVMKETYPEMPVFYQDPGTVKIPAGWLIEQCGWKGYRENHVGVYEKQALVLVNHGEATASELIGLSDRIIRSVREKFGIDLEREIRLL